VIMIGHWCFHSELAGGSVFLCFNGLKIGVFVWLFKGPTNLSSRSITQYHSRFFSIMAYGMHLWIVQKEFIFLETLEL